MGSGPTSGAWRAINAAILSNETLFHYFIDHSNISYRFTFHEAPVLFGVSATTFNTTVPPLGIHKTIHNDFIAPRYHS